MQYRYFNIVYYLILPYPMNESSIYLPIKPLIILNLNTFIFSFLNNVYKYIHYFWGLVSFSFFVKKEKILII